MRALSGGLIKGVVWCGLSLAVLGLAACGGGSSSTTVDSGGGGGGGGGGSTVTTSNITLPTSVEVVSSK